jgi:hypothetical protein
MNGAMPAAELVLHAVAAALGARPAARDAWAALIAANTLGAASLDRANATPPAVPRRHAHRRAQLGAQERGSRVATFRRTLRAGLGRLEAANITGENPLAAQEIATESCNWTSKDPLLLRGIGDTNLYAYAASDPINYQDASGLDPLLVAQSGVCLAFARFLPPGACGGSAGAPTPPPPPGGGDGDEPPVSGVRPKPPEDGEPYDVCGGNSKGPPGPKSRGICTLERTFVAIWEVKRYCQYYCPGDGSRPVLTTLPLLPCINPIAFGSGE